MSLPYAGILTQLAEHVGIDPASLLAHQVLRIEALDIFLQPGGVQDAPEVVLCSLLGMPPAPRLAEVLRTLMQANHRWLGTGGGILGLAPAGNAISWSLRVRSHDLDGATLAAAIAGYAALGQAWMQYLAVDVAASTPGSVPALNVAMRA
ncbi:Tir chaperone protein (CesT) [compost metagenome]